MKIYETAVRKPVSTILIYVAILVLGIFSLRNLSVDMYPEMDIPMISVITSYPGANASDIETNITRVLEDNLNTVSDLKKLTSRSSDNISFITLEFEWGADLNEAANDIRDAVSRAQNYLPEEVDQPTIFKFNSSMMPVMMFAITAEESYPALNKILDDKLVNTLNRLDGIGAVSVFGQPVREIQVNVDPIKLEAYGLTVERLGQIIAMENANIPAGTIDLGRHTINLKADGEFKSSDDLSKIIVSNFDGREIKLTDVATIKDTLQKSTIDERINSNQGVRVMIQKQSGANTVDIARKVMAMLPEIQASMPSDIQIGIIMDGSESIVDSINSLTETIMYAFIFVMLVVLFFLGRWRATVIIMLTIPISLMASFIYLYITGGTLNIISLSSLSIGIGLVVDDAIVVLENITKHMERGATPKEAAIYGTNEVWLAVIATTLTIVAVFLPLTMLGGMAGILFQPLGWIVTIVILVSMMAAVTLTPTLSALMLKTEHVHSYKGLGVIFKPIDRFLRWLEETYARILAWAVKHRLYTVLGTLIIFVLSLFAASKVPMEFFPTEDNAMISATVKLDQGVGVQYTASLARRIDSIIFTKYPEVEILSASAGIPGGNNMYAAMSESGLHMISYTMSLTKSSQRDRDIFEISDLIRKDLETFPEIKQFTVTPGGTSMSSMGGGSNVKLKIFGYNFDVANQAGAELLEKMKGIEGLRDIHLSREEMRPELNVRFDRDRLAYYGLNVSTAATFVRNRISGLTATKYREDGDEYDVIVRYDEPFRRSIEEVGNIMIYNSAGRGIKLSDVAVIEEIFAAPTIERENRQRMVSVDATLAPGVALGTVVAEVRQMLSSYQIPDELDVVVGGTVEDQGESFQDLLMLAVLIIMLVYIVMATQFESLLMPFIIMFTLIPAFSGVFFALWLTDTALSLIALIGAIMLIGIVVKNGIVMVDFTNLLRERGNTVNQSVIAAGKSRLRPVLMTSIATILGMLPLAIGGGEGSEIWQPMGIAIIGGLTFSTLLTLLLIPVIYSLFGQAGIRKKRRRLAEEQDELLYGGAEFNQ